MKALVQRVDSASVKVDGETVGKIGKGFLIFLGVTENDTEKEAAFLAKKTANLRIFTDENGKMNQSPLMLKEKGEDCRMLVVSQFTLCADCKGQNRPSFMQAAKPETADALYRYYVAQLGETYGFPTQTGVFGADMKVELTNDGPVTLWLDTEQL